jgi:hypothetical protein
LSKGGQAVYVDKAELAKLHPSWQALSDMKAVLARAGNGAGASRDRGAARTTDRGAAPSRTELAARSVIKAHQALAELEARKLEALRIRREAMKAQKLQSAEADWKADARNIEEAAAAQAGAIDQQYSPDLVNARLKAIAAEAITKVAAKDKSGIDQTAAKEALKNAQARVVTAGNADEAEEDRIMALASQKISALEDASDKRVEEQVHAYELDQSKRIASGIASAKDEIAKQMGPDAMAIAESRLAESAAASAGGSSKLYSNLDELRSAVAALQARIAKDVDVAVRDVAKKRGVNVTFQRRGTVPDATRTFEELIKKRGWNAYGPVMGGLGSS